VPLARHFDQYLALLGISDTVQLEHLVQVDRLGRCLPGLDAGQSGGNHAEAVGYLFKLVSVGLAKLAQFNAESPPSDGRAGSHRRSTPSSETLPFPARH
jgi:hypothetical protein